MKHASNRQRSIFVFFGLHEHIFSEKEQTAFVLSKCIEFLFRFPSYQVHLFVAIKLSSTLQIRFPMLFFFALETRNKSMP